MLVLLRSSCPCRTSGLDSATTSPRPNLFHSRSLDRVQDNEGRISEIRTASGTNLSLRKEGGEAGEGNGAMMSAKSAEKELHLTPRAQLARLPLLSSGTPAGVGPGTPAAYSPSAKVDSHNSFL